MYPEHILSKINKAYQDAVYSCSKAILTPVMGAIADVLQETVSRAVREGVKDASRDIREGIREALSPADIVGDLFFRRKK